MINIEAVDQKVEDGWLIFCLKSIEVSVTMSPANYESRKVTATFDVPEHTPVKVATPLFPGNGTQPENTVALQNVADQAQLLIQTLEDSITATFKKDNKGQW